MSVQTIGLLSALLNLSSIIPYVYSIIKGKARPNRVTWIIWSFLAWTLFIASLQSGAKATSFWLGSAVFNSTLIAILSFWRGVWKKDTLEISCFIFGIIGIVLWLVTKQASVSVYVGAIVDIIAIIPTVRKVLKDPLSEPKIAWTMGITAAVLNVLAIDSTKLVIIFPPVSVLFWHLLIVVPIYFKKHGKN
jgi:hypothetical protein